MFLDDPLVAKWIALAIFCVTYATFIMWFDGRALVASIAGVLSLVLGTVGIGETFWHYGATEGPLVNWNVMGVFFGVLIVAELFLYSKAPEAIAELLLSRTHDPRVALTLLAGFAGFISFFIENVASVLILAPIAFSVADKLEKDVGPILIGMVLMSNLHGCGTMIGDPPDMLLAATARMSFNDFFWLDGKPSLFFAVIVGSLTGLYFISTLYTDYDAEMDIKVRTPVISWVPAALIGLIIGLLILSAQIDPEFVWYAGTVCMSMAGLAVGWYVLFAPGGFKEPESEVEDLLEEQEESEPGGALTSGMRALLRPRSTLQKVWELIKGLDWSTTFFLIGVFIFVGAMAKYWAEPIAHGISYICGDDMLLAFLIIVGLSMLLSGFIDNIPYLVAMLPVVKALGPMLGIPEGTQPFFLYFGLLVGCSVGGNITPIGATANVVAMGLLRKRGEPITFWGYMKRGLPFTFAATGAASIFLILVWMP